MTQDHDEQLLNEFFQAARQQQITDDGFSDRIMQQLQAMPSPAMVQNRQTVVSQRAQRLSSIWTGFCWMLAVILFVSFDGWNMLTTSLKSFVDTVPSQINLTALLACLFVIPTLLIGEVLKHERTLH